MKYFLFTLFFLNSLIFSNEIIYTDPVNGASIVNIQNNITIGFSTDPVLDFNRLQSSIVVTGSISGNHSGKILFIDDNKKITFIPDEHFSLNEKVTVEFTGELSKFNKSGSKINNFTFYTSSKNINYDPVKGLEKETGVLLDKAEMFPPPPVLNVTVNNSPSAGQMFFAPFSAISNITILNNNGSTNWYQQRSTIAFDFKKQVNGHLTFFANNPPRYIEMNESYDTIHTYHCGNGYTTDMHELQILPNGNAFLMAYDPEPVDMSIIVPGGNPNATVIGLLIQEIDQNNNVLFQWRSWDHMHITDATLENLRDSVIDYVHGNAIEIDYDNNILISSRHLDEITKINRSTGNIMWRLGGKNNMFTILNDTMRFSHQHDIRRISNGNITFFDNGSFRFPEYSRALEYSLDEVNHIATLVWQFQRDPQVVSSWGGNVQRLANGNTFIAWGGAVNTVTEVKPDGTKVFEASYTPGIFTYRGYKSTWPHVPTGIDPVSNVPGTFKLFQNFPNPFNPATNISFNLDKAGITSVILYNINGQEVIKCFNGFLNEGFNSINVNGSELSSGVYFYRLISGNNSAVEKMILIK
jgi:hypothetical protein